MQISYKREPSFPTANHLGTVIDKLASNMFGLGNEYLEFKHVMEPFPNPILITTADVKIVYANPAWEQLTGYSLAEVEGKNPRFLKSDKTPKIIFKNMWKHLSRGEVFDTEDMIDKKKDGTEYHINSTIFPVKHDSKTILYVQIELDITNRKKLEELKREFLSTATHELKTPITTLKLLIQSQLRKLANKQVKKINIQELKLIDRELTRLTNIIDDLSDVARIESGKFRMEMKIVDISQIIFDAVTQMRTIAKGHRIVFKKDASIKVIADENRIKQVLINLIKNALKYSYPKSKVTITVLVKEKYCIVAVENNGVGIPRNNQPYIFDRFYQLHTGSNSGLGLGLYVSKKIIEQHKGKIWVKSYKCKLTTLYFSLLLA